MRTRCDRDRQLWTKINRKRALAPAPSLSRLMAVLSEEVGEALVGAAEATHTISVPAPTQRRSRRWLRVNVLLGKLIVGLLVLLAWKGFQLVVLQMGEL